MKYKETIKKIITRMAFGGVIIFSFASVFGIFHDIVIKGHNTISKVTWQELIILLIFIFITNIIIYSNFYHKSKE